MHRFFLSAASAAFVPFVPAGAETAAGDIPASIASASTPDSGAGASTEASAEPVPGDAAAAHPDSDQAIVITGVKRTAGDVLGGVSILDEDELLHDMKPSLGDTLADLPGVTATSFGPSASRPILRGEQGERVRVLVDGIGSLDLSASDPDHAVAINPLTAQRIEVLRGPSALLFGSSAIGGVVNVIDRRIPRKLPTRIDLVGTLSYATAANERSANVAVDVPLAGKFVAHFDGAYQKYDDLHVGGHLLSRQLREQALASPDPDIRALADLKDKIPNSAGRVGDIAAGIGYVDGDTNIGVSVSRHSFRYGVPVRFSLDPQVEPEAPTLDGRQDRADARVNLDLGTGFLKTFEFRGGIGRYHHDELNPEGKVNSSFFTNGGELRADVVQSDRGGWGGTSGVQYLSNTARIDGEEKYLPDSKNRQLGLFTLQSVVAGKVRVEAGARIEFARLHADEDAQIAANGALIGTVPISRSYTPVSGSLGGTYEFLRGWRGGLSLSHSERAPAVNELFSNGPHGGSEQFLVGNPTLTTEKSNGAELSVHRTTGPVHVQGSIYYNRFSNFIFEAPTGEIRDALPVYEYRQGQADYFGFELESDVKFGRALGITWGGELVTDAVRAKIKQFGNAPEIPPFRVLGGLTGSVGQVDGRLEVEGVSAQRKTAPNETSTPGYTMVNASFDWHPFAANPELALSLTANNLFDVVARRHSSDLKDYAPLAGRDIRVSARINF